MKRFFLVPILCLLALSVAAQPQIVEGTVYDSQTGEAISGVVIYLNGTTTITVSDSEGMFRLTIDNNVNTSLIFSHLSYDPLVFRPPFNLMEKSFYLNPKVIMIEEARVIANIDRFSRGRKLKAFKDQFLGESKAGRSCTILNEEDIVLNYDHTANRLSVFSLHPLIIRNDYLAYLLTYDLTHFMIRYKKNTLNSSDIEQCSFMGMSSFIDQSHFNFTIAVRRNEMYGHSRAYFWKNLTEGTLEYAKLKMYSGGRPMMLDEHFCVTDSVTYSIIQIDTTIHKKITVWYQNRFISEMIVITDRIMVDRFGNIDAFDKVRYQGDMGRQRIGEMLPRDYVFNSTQIPQRFKR